MIWDSPDAQNLIDFAQRIVLIASVLVVALTLLRRYRGASPVLRRCENSISVAI